MNKVEHKGIFKTVIKMKEMEDDMFKEIEKLAHDAVEAPKDNKFKDEMDISNFLKEKLEDKYKDKDLCWHVIIGRNFGGYVTYKEKVMTYFYIGQVGFLIFGTVRIKDNG